MGTVVTSDGTGNAKWTSRDYQLVLLCLLIKFGDSVEIYLPGVITQKVRHLSLADTQVEALLLT